MMRRLRLVLLLVVCCAFASSAMACEVCVWKFGVQRCDSGNPIGYQWCFGGFGEPCIAEDYCEEPRLLAAPLEVQSPESGPLGEPADCTDCDDEAPRGGFTLVE